MILCECIKCVLESFKVTTEVREILRVLLSLAYCLGRVELLSEGVSSLERGNEVRRVVGIHLKKPTTNPCERVEVQSGIGQVVGCLDVLDHGDNDMDKICGQVLGTVHNIGLRQKTNR